MRLHSVSGAAAVEFHAQAAGSIARSLAEAEAGLEKLLRSDYRTVVTWPRRGEGERAAHNLARLSRAGSTGRRGRTPALSFAHANLREGFVAPSFGLAVIPEHRLYRRRQAGQGAGRRSGAAAARCGRSPTCAPATSSSTRPTGSPGSPASTRGRSPGSPATTSTSSTRATTASTCRPTSWRKISRYVGAGGEHPPLSKLGGTRWDTMKARARRAAQELAGELLQLYAERQAPRRATRSGPTADWQREFEQRFPYTETPDQRDAIEAVKSDMEAPRPMDRLICGDVGYGKTEVALRAAFKAAARRHARC